jgi:hypothetical protein
MSRAEWYQTTRFPSMINHAKISTNQHLNSYRNNLDLALSDYFAALQNNNNKTHK